MKDPETTWLSSGVVKQLLPDVHSEKPGIQLHLDHVGIKNYRVKLIVCNTVCESMHLSVDMYVDLPATLRGVHMSRFIEAINEAKQEAYRNTRDFLWRVVDEVLKRHEYALKAEVCIKYEQMTESNDVIKVKRCMSETRDGDVEELLKVSMWGITACPCVQKIYSYLENCPIEKSPTHLQRTLLKISIKQKGGISIDPIDVYRVCKLAFSNTLTDRLKRAEEYIHVKKTIANPRFVEDVARYAVKHVIEAFSNNLHNDSLLTVEVNSYESIHSYDTYAYIEADIGSLKRLLAKL